MWMFWLSIGALGILALGFLFWPLVRYRRQSAIPPDAAARDNLQIFSDRTAELILETKQQLISPAEFKALQLELEKNLLLDVPDTAPQAPTGTISIGSVHWLIAACVGAGVFAASLATYLFLGRSADLPDYGSQTSIAAALTDSAENTDRPVIASLEQQVNAHPQDLDNRLLLAKSYLFAQQYRKAANAYSDLLKITPTDDARYARLLSANAEALYMAAGEAYNADVDALASQSLQRDPGDFTALTLKGIGAFQQGNFQQAIMSWQAASVTAPQEQVDGFLQPAIASARMQLEASEVKSVPVASAVIKVRVELAAEYASHVQPDNIVFVIARAPGEKMPLALRRLQVKELPAEVLLDDSSALMPGQKLSALAAVELLARVSKSGQAALAPGDLTTAAIPATVGNEATVTLRINREIK